MNSPPNWVVLARFGRPHGVHGFVRVHSFTDPQDQLLSYTNWHVFLRGTWQPIKVSSIKVHNNSIVAQIEGYPDREGVAHLTNAEIAVKKEQLAELKPGEYYWHQLMGMNVVNTKNESLGTLVEIMPTGTHDVLVVRGKKKYLIPYLPQRYVMEVNEALGLIIVDWDVDF